MDFLTIFLILFCVFFVFAVLNAVRVRRARAARARALNAGGADVVFVQQSSPNYAYDPYQGGYSQGYPGQTYNQNVYNPTYAGNSNVPPPGYSQPYYYPPNNNP